MSKTKTLFTVALLVLLGSMGATQAQNTFVTAELVTQPQTAARMGGESEKSGSVWFTFSTDDALARTTVTLHYSVPLAGDMASSSGTDFTSAVATVVGTAANDENDDNGTIVVDMIQGSNTTLVIRNVMLDVSEASGPITVTGEIKSSNDTDFLRFDGPNIGTVINDIVVGVEVKADAGTVRTRGTGSEGVAATLTLEEAYTDAFMMGDELKIEFSGIPDDTELEAEVTGIKIDDPDAVDEDGQADPVVTTNMDAYATVSGVSSTGSATVMLGGDDMTSGSDMRVAPDEVVLNLTLTAKGPLDVGEVMAEVTFAGDNFDKVLTLPATVFKIRPAQCELLFPVVTVTEPADGNWDTAISVTNPAYADEMASGGLTFTFYGQGQDAEAEPPMFQTSPSSPGTGLSPDGTLAIGGTYQVMASQILGATDWGTRFVGHVHLLADYTNCSGLGWVTDWMTVNQAYKATVINADTGSDN